MSIPNIWRGVVKRLSRLTLPDYRRTVIHTHINGCSLLVLGNEDVGRAIHFGQKYELPETKYLERVIAQDSICIDVGANIGYFTMLMAKVASSGTVYSFEPIPLNAALIRASARLNEFENIQVVECAVGATNGEVQLSQSVDSAYSSIRDTERKALDRVLNVPLINLDAFSDQQSIRSIAILKIDVEGAEGLVIEGSRVLLTDKSRRPKIVMMELSDDNLRSYGTKATEIVERMLSIGYTPFFVNTKADLIAFEPEKLNLFYNVVFLESGSPGHG